MNSITSKSTTLRKARAQSVLLLSQESTAEALRARAVPKGDVFEFARAAGLLAIKRTSDAIPDCHPLPVEGAWVRLRLEGLRLHIECEVHAIYRTGVEIEALHGAMIAALTALDMLKPLDPKLEITETRVLEKSGGKSLKRAPAGLRAAVIVCSDSVHAGQAEDRSGRAIAERLRNFGCAHVSVEVVPDEPERIQTRARAWIAERADLVLFTGGTGLSPRDRTPEAVAPLLEREIPGIMESARSHGRERTPMAMLSRGIAGFAGQTLLLTLPGSLRGVEECMDALFPSLFHLFEVREGARHDTPGP